MLPDLIIKRLQSIQYGPLFIIDLILALSLVVFTLAYLRRFPVFRVVLGVVFLLCCSVFFFWIGLILTALVIGVFTNIVLISLPLIFAPELRHYLEKIGRFPFLRVPNLTNKQKQEAFIGKLVAAAFELSERKIGASVVLQRRTGLGQTIETGVYMNALFSASLLESIFYPKSPLHDGAAIIAGNRVIAANCLLPISADVKLEPPFGTRHAASLAITKDTDAVVIIISEERGEVTLAENGKLHINLKRAELEEKLLKLL